MNAPLPTLAAVLEQVKTARAAGKKIVTTNGCFDLLHTGHLTYLEEARALGDLLIVGINSDESVKVNKGDKRPVNTAPERARLVGALKPVDGVFVFDEKDPVNFIRAIKPDIHVKGGDYQGRILEQDAVEQNGGRVQLLTLVPNRSTTLLISRIAEAYGTERNGRA